MDNITRFILEMNQYLLLSSIYEVHSFDISKPIKIISLVVAIIILLFWVYLIIFVVVLSLFSYEAKEDGHNKIGELFSGVKMQRKMKMFVAILLQRKLVFILLAILVSISSRMLIGILSIFQVFYIAYVIFLRPFKEAKNNLTEIINELFFFVLFSSLIYLNTKDKWSSSQAIAYSTIITANSLVILVIILGSLL